MPRPPCHPRSARPVARPRLALAPLLAFAVSTAGCGGCEREEEPTALGRGVPSRGPGSPAAAPSALAPAPAPGPGAPDPGRPSLAELTKDRDLAADPRAGQGARDLEVEVARAFGTPTRCFPADFLARRPGTLVVSIFLVLEADGTVSGARVSAGGAPEDVRACLEAHAESLVLPSPIPEAPRRVTTSVTYELSVEDVPAPAAPQGAAPAPGAPTAPRRPTVPLEPAPAAPNLFAGDRRPAPSEYQVPPDL